jgi:hypothetical protein
MATITGRSIPEVSAPAVSRPLGRLRSADVPISLKLILFSLFLPEATSFFVGGLRLTVTRLLLILLTPVVFSRLQTKCASGCYRFVWSDFFVSASALWMFLGPSVTYGVLDTVVHSGPVVLEYLVAYLSTRVLLTENRQAEAFVSLLCAIMIFVVLDACLDVATGRYFTRELLEQLTGYQKVWSVDDEVRFGLLRAAGPMEHPILFGFVSSIGLLLAVAISMRRRTLKVAACALGVVISLSSAPEQSAVMGLAFLAYSRVFRKLPRKWLILSVVPTITMIVLFIATPTPFGHLFDLLTIDSQTAYYRLYIWNEVGPAILDNPWFAVPDGAYDYRGSIDSVWLVLSLSYGIPCAALTGLSMIGACSLPTDWPHAYLTEAASRLGAALGIAIFLVIFMGFTVHFWGTTWILIGLLLGLRAHLGELGQLNKQPRLALRAPPAGTAGL